MQAMDDGWDYYPFVKNKAFLCIKAYYRNFLIIEKANIHALNDLVKAAKIVFVEFGHPRKTLKQRWSDNFADRWT